MGCWEMTNSFETSVPLVPLSICKYEKQKRILSLAYKDLKDVPAAHPKNVPVRFMNGFPARVNIHSEKTGRTVSFYPVGPNDRLYDEDHWDGEQQIYRPHVVDGPRVVLETVDHLVIHRG